MPVTEKQIQQAWAMGELKEGELSQNAFSASVDNDSSIPAGSVGEVASVEVGADGAGSLSDVLALFAGVEPDAAVRTGKGKPDVHFEDSGGVVVPDNTQYRLAVRARNERGGQPLFDWRKVGRDDLTNSGVDFSNIKPLRPQKVYARERKVVTLQLYNEDSSVAADINSSNFDIPYRYWEG